VVRPRHLFVALLFVVLLFGCDSEESSAPGGDSATTPTPPPPAADVAAINRLVQYLNGSSATSADAGVAAAAASSYAVWSATVAPEQCAASIKSSLGYLQSARCSLAVPARSLVAKSERSPDPSGDTVQGQIYTAQVDVDIVGRDGPVLAHVDGPTEFVVVRDGSAKHVVACAPAVGH
jgi:hypothetical protein